MLLLQARKLGPKLRFSSFVIAALVAPWFRLRRPLGTVLGRVSRYGLSRFG